MSSSLYVLRWPDADSTSSHRLKRSISSLPPLFRLQCFVLIWKAVVVGYKYVWVFLPVSHLIYLASHTNWSCYGWFFVCRHFFFDSASPLLFVQQFFFFLDLLPLCWLRDVWWFMRLTIFKIIWLQRRYVVVVTRRTFPVCLSKYLFFCLDLPVCRYRFLILLLSVTQYCKSFCAKHVWV